MPYSKNPVKQTYDTKRVSFVTNPQQRSSNPSKDARLVNMMTEVVESPLGNGKKYYVKSRPGMSATYSHTAGEGRGIYFWTKGTTEYCIYVIGNKVYANGTLAYTLSTSTGECGFTEFVSSTGTVYLILLDGINGYVITDPLSYIGWIPITDPNFPTPHIPNPIYLDAYLFVAKAGTADIYNSNLDSPTVWTAGDYFSTDMYPDKIKALSKNNNYIYAIGSNSVEYLYNAAVATGSPLGRHDSAVQQFGTAAPGTVVQTEQEVIFVGETGNGGHTVWTIDGFKAKEIGIPMVKQALFAEGIFLPYAKAHCIRVASQKLYFICLTYSTLVYSFDTEMWHEWETGVGQAFIGTHATDGPYGYAYVLGKSDGTVYTIGENLFLDGSTPITCTLVTPKLDFDSLNRKFIHRLALVGDVPGYVMEDNEVSVYWSDNDYKTWSAERTLILGPDLPAISQLGSFRRRAFKFVYALPYLLRLEGFEVDINKGSA